MIDLITQREGVRFCCALAAGIALLSVLTPPVEGAGWLTSNRLPGSDEAVPAGSVIATELVTGGLDDPIGVTNAGDGTDRLFIVEQDGTISIFDGSQVLPTPFLDIVNKVSCCGEQGLLGLAFHPDYGTNGLFYVNYTDNNGDTVIAQYSVSGDPDVADQGSEVILKSVDQPFTNHNGGHLVFGPDGFLYAGLGDGGNFNDEPFDNAQDLGTLLGKMLRLDVDSPPDYIPADNPFLDDPTALDEIWAYGLRNPWRYSFDRDTGDLFIGDVGQNTVEEVSFQPAASSGGENYGWNTLEGSNCFEDEPPGACDDLLNGGSVLPIIEYGHDGGNCSITGGHRYRGSQHPELGGMYFHGDFCSGRIWGSTEDAPGVWSTGEPLDTGFSISSFGEDEAGELYFTHLSFAGELHQIVGTGSGIPCEDVMNFQARCIMGGPGNRLQFRVTMTDLSHDGEAVTVEVDGDPEVVTINGRRAQLSINGAASGMHTVELVDPAGCFAAINVVCP